METPPESEGGVSREEPKGAEGGIPRDTNVSFYEIPDERTTQHSLLLLLRVEQEDGRSMPSGTHTEWCISQKILQWTGITPEQVIRAKPFDTVVEVAAEVPIVTVAQQLHLIREWEEIPVNVSCIMGKREYIMDVVHHSSEFIEQREETEREIQRTHIEAREQKETLTHLVDCVNQKAWLISDLQAQSLQGSIPRIPSTLSTPIFVSQPEEKQPYKMSKTPDLPNFSGEIPTPKGKAEFDNWIFQIKSLQKTYTDDVIRNVVVSHMRGIANTVVRTMGYDAELPKMISWLEDRFGLGKTNDNLLLEFHQMVQGPNKKVQDFGSKLECKFKILQERFPGRYTAVQLKDRFFSGMHDKMHDSMQFLYTQDDCSFSKLLKAVMTAEAEYKSRVLVKAKAAAAEIVTNPANQELTSIQSQLDSMSKILKSAQFNKDSKKVGSKKVSNSKSAEAKPQKSKGPAISAAGPFTGGKPPIQCHRCMGWGHYKCNCSSRGPVQGSVEWENLHWEVALKGAPLSQVKEHPRNPQ